MEYNVKYHLNEEKKIKDHHKDNKMIIFSEQGHKKHNRRRPRTT